MPLSLRVPEPYRAGREAMQACAGEQAATLELNAALTDDLLLLVLGWLGARDLHLSAAPVCKRWCIHLPLNRPCAQRRDTMLDITVISSNGTCWPSAAVLRPVGYILLSAVMSEWKRKW